ncbi:hypothetical protein C1645_742317 [Glomus cerebriforme]|uniref:Uncharacterized protein n=1 Tax=Glomus cerebriforme TaxID=658196 RepID=A0A397SFX8_9GLOM|nr:hypothetical protein C1645_742317 [Glomus cerebriforme]
MINPSPRRYMHSDATKLSSADYKDIMQYRDMKSKPLEELRKKFHISTSRLYQIWRGQEVGRVEWNYSAVPLSYSSKNNIDRQDISETLAECITTAESKVKKAGRKKTKSKSVHISELPVIQTPLTSKSLNISNEELGAFYEKEDKRDRKITEELNRILAT